MQYLYAHGNRVLKLCFILLISPWVFPINLFAIHSLETSGQGSCCLPINIFQPAVFSSKSHAQK
jgi:hypothetical protein